MNKLLINITRKQAYLYASFCVLYEFLTYIANDMIMPAMIKVVASFQAPLSAIPGSLTAYLLGGATLQLFLGPFSDRFGRRPVMLFGALFFLVCTIFIACSHSMNEFIIARFFQGMGLCFIAVVGYATIQEIFPEMDAVRLISIMANVAIIAPLLGPLLGALVIEYFSWRMIFVMVATGTFIALWGLWHYMPESVSVQATARPVWHDYKQLLLNLPFMMGSVVVGLMTIPCLAWIALAPVILIKNAQLTFIQYGLLQIPVFGAYVLGNIVLHRMTHRGELKGIIWFGVLWGSVSLLFLFLLPYCIKGTYIWLLPGLISYFFGLGVLSAPLNRLILVTTTVSKGTATAVMNIIDILLLGGGIEVANRVYASNNNVYLGAYAAVVGMIALIIIYWTLQQLPGTSVNK